MNILLFGHRNSGKTTLGTALSSHLNFAFIDTDKEVEALYLQKNHKKASYKEIFLENESQFRDLEKKAILSLDCENTVISLGGGALLDLETKKFIQKLPFLFYLKISEDTFLKRALLNPPPLFKDIASLKKIYEKRTELFESIKAYVIDSAPINSQIEQIKNVIK